MFGFTPFYGTDFNNLKVLLPTEAASFIILAQGVSHLGIINHFIFKALIFWEKVKVSLGFEN